jgi:hypothetical protein
MSPRLSFTDCISDTRLANNLVAFFVCPARDGAAWTAKRR